MAIPIQFRYRVRHLAHAAAGLVLLSCACASGCSPDERTYDTASSGTGGTADSASNGSGGNGGSSNSSSSGTGAGGGLMAGDGPGAVELVNAGTVSKSPGYRMVFTLGQPSTAQGTMEGQSHRLQGGLVGANGSLK